MAYEQDPTDPTGIRDETPRGNSEVARARNRKANAALQLRHAGASWEDVAEVLGFPNGDAALVATERALEKELKSEETQKFMRTLAGQRFDRLLRAVWRRAINEEDPDQLAYWDRAVKVIAEYNRLQGLNAPTEVLVTNPTQAELERWVSTVTSYGTVPVEEDDIFEVDVIEGEVHSVNSGEK